MRQSDFQPGRMRASRCLTSMMHSRSHSVLSSKGLLSCQVGDRQCSFLGLGSGVGSTCSILGSDYDCIPETACACQCQHCCHCRRSNIISNRDTRVRSSFVGRMHTKINHSDTRAFDLLLLVRADSSILFNLYTKSLSRWALGYCQKEWCAAQYS